MLVGSHQRQHHVLSLTISMGKDAKCGGKYVHKRPCNVYMIKMKHESTLQLLVSASQDP